MSEWDPSPSGMEPKPLLTPICCNSSHEESTSEIVAPGAACEQNPYSFIHTGGTEAERRTCSL